MILYSSNNKYVCLFENVNYWMPCPDCDAGRLQEDMESACAHCRYELNRQRALEEDFVRAAFSKHTYTLRNVNPSCLINLYRFIKRRGLSQSIGRAVDNDDIQYAEQLNEEFNDIDFSAYHKLSEELNQAVAAAYDFPF